MSLITLVPCPECFGYPRAPGHRVHYPPDWHGPDEYHWMYFGRVRPYEPVLYEVSPAVCSGESPCQAVSRPQIVPS